MPINRNVIKEELSLEGYQFQIAAKKEKQMARQSPNSVPTPLKKQEPTADIWKQGGDKSADAAISRDKSSVRQPVDK